MRLAKGYRLPRPPKKPRSKAKARPMLANAAKGKGKPKGPRPELVDPTGTSHLVRQALAGMARRLAALRSAIWQLVAVQDAFGLDIQAPDASRLFNASTVPGGNPTFRFGTNADKLTAFQAWLRQQVADGLLEVVPTPGDLPGAGPSAPWLAQYVRPTYKKGLLDAHGAAPGLVAGGKLPMDRAEFLRDAFDSPVATSKLAALYQREYIALKGMTDAMDASLSRILTDAMAQGHGAYKTAQRMVEQVDAMARNRAKTIARTELVHAHAEGTLDGYAALGIDSVLVMVEWTTAALPCPACGAMRGVVLTLQEARGLIPRHPNCRCAWRPAPVAATGSTLGAGKGSKWEGKSVDAAIAESVKATAKKGASLEDAVAATTWAGGERVGRPVTDKKKWKPTESNVRKAKAELASQLQVRQALTVAQATPLPQAAAAAAQEPPIIATIVEAVATTTGQGAAGAAEVTPKASRRSLPGRIADGLARGWLRRVHKVQPGEYGPGGLLTPQALLRLLADAGWVDMQAFTVQHLPWLVQWGKATTLQAQRQALTKLPRPR